MSLQLRQPGRDIAVDECMERFQGRSHDTVKIPSKPIKRGYKIWAIASEGYFFSWIWHQRGKGPLFEHNERPLRKLLKNNTSATVPVLLTRLPEAPQDRHYIIYLDNLFTSVPLFVYLRSLGFRASGTANPKSGIWKKFLEIKAQEKKNDKLHWGWWQQEVTPDNLVMQTAWKDNGLVLMLSTSHLAEENSVVEVKEEAKGIRKGMVPGTLVGTAHTLSLRKRPAETSTAASTARAEFGEEWIKILPIPLIIHDYNQRMNSVDRGDGLRTWADGPRRIRRGGWKALWHFLLNVAITNCFILSGQRDHSKWITSLVKALLEKGDSLISSKKRKRASVVEGAKPISEGKHYHHHHRVELREKRGECVECKKKGNTRAPNSKRRALGELSLNARRQLGRAPSSTYRCNICKVPLCKEGSCFKDFHCKG
jgi:hypothetical protein